MISQFIVQLQAVVVTIAWCGIGSIIIFLIVRALVGGRPREEAEREGLDLSSHGESAYHA